MSSKNSQLPEVPEAALKMIGQEKVRNVLVTTRDIIRYSQAVEQEPLIRGDEMFAPLLFCQSLTYEDVPFHQLPPDGTPIELVVPLNADKTVGGSSDYKFYRSVKAGETITVTSQLKSVTPKLGRSGPFFLVAIETRFDDEDGKPVAIELASYVKRA